MLFNPQLIAVILSVLSSILILGFIMLDCTLNVYFDYNRAGYLTWVMFVISIFFAVLFSYIALRSYKSWSKKLSV